MKWLVEKWDWMVYRISQGSIRRICEANPGMAYLFELWIRGWNEEHPISDQLKKATEIFFESQRQKNQN